MAQKHTGSGQTVAGREYEHQRLGKNRGGRHRRNGASPNTESHGKAGGVRPLEILGGPALSAARNRCMPEDVLT